jgi:hypothetical protein
MASSPWVLGPCGLYVGPQNVGPSSLNFVGVGRQAPSIDHQPAYRPVHTDFGGGSIQTDDVFAGEKAMLTLDLMQTVPAQLEFLESFNLGTIGVHGPGARGTLMVAEGKMLTVAILFPLVALKPTLYAGRPNGYRYVCCKVMSLVKPPHDMAEACPTRVTFECIELMSFVNGLPSFLLYDEVVAGLPPMS